MVRNIRELLGAFFITLGSVLSVASVINFMDGLQGQLQYQRCLIAFILGILDILVGFIVFYFKAEKKVISIFFSLSMAVTFLCFITNFALLIADLPTIDLFSIVGMIFFILTHLCTKKYFS